MPNRIRQKIRIMLTRPDKILRWMISRITECCGRKILIICAEIVVLFLPYSKGTKLFSWFCRQGWAQAIFFRKQVHLVRQCLTMIAAPINEKEVIQQSLTSHFCRFWRLAALARCTPQQFDYWVTITGVATLQHANQQGKGVILLGSHTTLGQLLPLILVHLGFDKFFTVGNNYWVLKLIGLEKLKESSLLGANVFPPTNELLIRQLHKGKQILKHGGIVQMAPAGIYGNSGIHIPFHGQKRFFKAGFAELATSTQAEVIPVFISMETTGHVKVAFFEPLNLGHSKLNHQEQVDFIMKQYANFMEQLWSEELGSLQWWQLWHFLLGFPSIREQVGVTKRNE